MASFSFDENVEMKITIQFRTNNQNPKSGPLDTKHLKRRRKIAQVILTPENYIRCTESGAHKRNHNTTTPTRRMQTAISELEWQKPFSICTLQSMWTYYYIFKVQNHNLIDLNISLSRRIQVDMNHIIRWFCQLLFPSASVSPIRFFYCTAFGWVCFNVKAAVASMFAIDREFHWWDVEQCMLKRALL